MFCFCIGNKVVFDDSGSFFQIQCISVYIVDVVVEQIGWISILMMQFGIEVEFVRCVIVVFQDFVINQCYFFNVVWELVCVLIQLCVVVVGIDRVKYIKCECCGDFVVE